MDTGLDTVNYSFEWFLNGSLLVSETDSVIIPDQGGTYSVIVTNIATGCVTAVNDPNTITNVIVSSPPVLDYTTTAAFASTHVINVVATGSGDYEFSIDNGSWVSNSPNTNSYTFSNVAPGEHIITVRDINDCGEDQVRVILLDYPLFFTPNGDGYNDNWQILGINNQPDAVIYIFDRYGKLLKQLSPTGIGWDGTFNGQPMPSSDYWFLIKYRDPNNLTGSGKKEFNAHFTLKR
ncbi:T9SS type B sorting domain-containing protein [Lacinutrix sp. C3R15]|nr:T9SS type B sorting domain-containing protein [Lacinutrix sp. C3R15]